MSVSPSDDRNQKHDEAAHPVESAACSALDSRISVVLVRSIYPRNIGMCARAMANMGVGRLVLVAPQCELTEEAKQGATKAQKVLRESVRYANLEDFHAAEGEGTRIALSARGGRLRLPERLDLKLQALGTKPSSRLLDSTDPIYMMFGPEDDGLSDDEIRHVHHVCSLPTFGDFFSMNLSHAVMLSLYVLRTFLSANECQASPPSGEPSSRESVSGESLSHESLDAAPARRSANTNIGPMFFPENTIDRWLETVGFNLGSRRVNAGRVIKRVLLENEPTPDELRVLEAIIQQTIRKLNRL